MLLYVHHTYIHGLLAIIVKNVYHTVYFFVVAYCAFLYSKKGADKYQMASMSWPLSGKWWPMALECTLEAFRVHMPNRVKTKCKPTLICMFETLAILFYP